MSQCTFTRLGIGVAALGVVMVLAAEAAHATTTVWAHPPVPSFENGGLYTEGTDSAEQLTIGFDVATKEFLVADPAGVVVRSGYEGSCTHESPTVARCPQLAPFVEASLRGGDDRYVGDVVIGRQVSVFGGTGNDTITALSARGLLFGDSGDDVLTGARGFQSLRGGDGHDRLMGREGADYLRGGPGSDWLAGQGGNDYLIANDGKRDRALRCGGTSGDAIIFDEGLDPAPIGCRHLNEPDAWP